MSNLPNNKTADIILLEPKSSLNINPQDAIPISSPLIPNNNDETSDDKNKNNKLEKSPLLSNSNSMYGTVPPVVTQSEKIQNHENSSSHELLKLNSVRLINKDGSLNIKRISVSKTPYLRDYFHTLVNGPWVRVIAIFAILFALLALVFGILLYIERDGLLGDGTKSFSDVYFFSLEIMTTITFGDLIPESIGSKIIFAIETFLYTIFQACIFAIFTTKFAQAQSSAASILFSDKAIIAKKEKDFLFMFRIANLRKHQFLDVRLRVFVVYEDNAYGETAKFVPLKLNFDESVPFLGLPWTVIHNIDDTSPLKSYTKDNFKDIELVVFMEGTDGSTSNSFQARYSYKSVDIIWDATFVNPVYKQNGAYVVDFKKFHAIERN